MIGTRIARGCAFVVLSATGVTAASAPTQGELRAAFSSREPPRLAWQGQVELTIAVVERARSRRCHRPLPERSSGRDRGAQHR